MLMHTQTCTNKQICGKVYRQYYIILLNSKEGLWSGLNREGQGADTMYSCVLGFTDELDATLDCEFNRSSNLYY